MRLLFYRYLFCTTIAAVGFAILFALSFVGALAIGRFPAPFTSGTQALRTISGIVGQILLAGAAIALYATINGTGDEPEEVGPERGFAAIGDLIGQLWSVVAVTIGGGGIAAGLTVLISDLAAVARTGVWHITSFCQSTQPPQDRLCPVHVPVFSLIFNAPAFIPYFVIGVLLLRQNMRTFRGYPG